MLGILEGLWELEFVIYIFMRNIFYIDMFLWFIVKFLDILFICNSY